MSEMPWSLWRFTGTTLVPRGAFDLKLVAEKYSVDTILRGKFAKPRSKPNHNLYWSVLDEVVEATGAWQSREDLHEAVKLHLRMIRGVEMLGGLGVRYITRSINFDSMEQGEFNIFFKKAMVAIEESTGVDTDEIIERLKQQGAKEAA